MRSSRPRANPAVTASEITATTAPIRCPRRRGAGARLLFHPPTIEPTLNAARNVEINQAHTMIEEPKWGFNSREARS